MTNRAPNYFNDDNGRACDVTPHSGGMLVVFGRLEMDGGLQRLAVSHARPSRVYKTRKGANNAVAAWLLG